MAQPTTRETLKDYALRALGQPVKQITTELLLMQVNL
jgi:hypothetical protein